MILSQIEALESSENLLKSAAEMGQKLKKDCAILRFVAAESEIEQNEKAIASFLREKGLSQLKIFVYAKRLNALSEICEQLEISFLFLQLPTVSSTQIQKRLNACRDLRIPYLLYKNDFAALNLEKVLVPIVFLEEEYEKAQFASAFGRFYQSEIRLLVAKDYGSKAATTAQKMAALFDKFALNYRTEKAHKDSFGVEKEAIQLAMHENYGITLISASRDYGLDDLIFGPKERKLIKKSNLPVLLVNPRWDLYALCD